MSPRQLQQNALAEFDRLIVMNDQVRANALAAMREDDAELAQAVEALLRADADASGVLDRGIEALAAHFTNPQSAVPSAYVEQRIGAFVLKRALGRGGMGEVWLAERRDGAFVQQVAIKLLKRGMDSEAINARFLQERRILAELNHSHIARFIDGGMTDDGRLYFAMEYIDGNDLLTHCRSKHLSLAKRVQLMLQVCGAIAHAQSHLIVHRDLKPSNIFVDVHGQPRVLDFGIAKLLTSDRGQDATAPDAAPETGTGSLLMSPAYAAPEQILGEPVSTATDVYALGLILFELLTEQRPHQRDVASIRALMANVQADITQSPSAVLKQRSHVTRPWKQINQDLDTIVLTALKRDPARRYFNAQTMADDLKRWQQGQPIAAQPDTRTYRIKRFVARNRVAVGSASAVFLALLVGLSVALWQAGMARAQARLAITEYQRAEAARIESDRMILFIRARMGEGDPKLHQEGANLRLQTWLEQSLPKIESHQQRRCCDPSRSNSACPW